MKKKFQYFNQAQCFYRKGKLYRINVWVDVGKEYSQVGTEEQLKNALSDLARQFCLPRPYFNHVDTYLAYSPTENKLSDIRHEDRNRNVVWMSYVVKYAKVDFFNHRRYLIDISDSALKRSLDAAITKVPK